MGVAGGGSQDLVLFVPLILQKRNDIPSSTMVAVGPCEGAVERTGYASSRSFCAA